MLIDGGVIDTVVDLSGLSIFSNAIVKNCIISCQKSKKVGETLHTLRPEIVSDLAGKQTEPWPYNEIRNNPGHSLKLDFLSPKYELGKRLKSNSYDLGDLCYVTFGLRSCAKGKGGGGKERLIVDGPIDKSAKRYLEGREITRYSSLPSGRYIRYIPEQMYSPRSPVLFETNKIISQTMLSKKRIVATLDDQGYYVEQSLLCIIPHGILTKQVPLADYPLEFLLAMINSTLQSFYFSSFLIDFSLGGGLIHATPGTQQKLIIPKIVDREMVEHIRQLVKQLLEVNRQILRSDPATIKEALVRQSKIYDDRIDQLIYQLYGLNESEKEIIKESTA